MSWVLLYLYRYRWNCCAVPYTGGPASALRLTAARTPCPARPRRAGRTGRECCASPLWRSPPRPSRGPPPRWPRPRHRHAGGATIANFRPVSSGRFLTSHSGLSLISPSNGSLVFSNASRKSCGTGSPSGQNAPVVVVECRAPARPPDRGPRPRPRWPCGWPGGSTRRCSSAGRRPSAAASASARCRPPRPAPVGPHTQVVGGAEHAQPGGRRINGGGTHELCPLAGSSANGSSRPCAIRPGTGDEICPPRLRQPRRKTFHSFQNEPV